MLTVGRPFRFDCANELATGVDFEVELKPVALDMFPFEAGDTAGRRFPLDTTADLMFAGEPALPIAEADNSPFFIFPTGVAGRVGELVEIAFLAGFERVAGDAGDARLFPLAASVIG